MFEPFGNRHLYKGGRAIGPPRLLNFITCVGVTGTGPEVCPLIFGDPVGRAGFWRDIGNKYKCFMSIAQADTSRPVPFYQQFFTTIGGPIGGTSFFHQDPTIFDFETLMAYLLSKKLYVSKIGVQIRASSLFNPATGTFTVNGDPSQGSFPNAICVFDGSENNNYYQKISPHTYNPPQQGIPKSNAGVKQNPHFLEIPCDIILGPQSAIVFDIATTSAPGAIFVSLTVQEFA